MHSKETRIERNTCTPMFITALFIIARTWKQPRCPSADEWIRKLWYLYMKEYYSAIKRNAFESVLMRWMTLEPIIQSEISQKEKDKYCTLTHILEKAMAPHSSTLAWKIPWTEGPGGLQSMGLLGVSDTTERLPFHFSLSCIGEGNGGMLDSVRRRRLLSDRCNLEMHRLLSS